jgi:hypothetical protein
MAWVGAPPSLPRPGHSLLKWGDLDWIRDNCTSGGLRELAAGCGSILERVSDRCSVNGVCETNWARRTKQTNPQFRRWRFDDAQCSRSQPER